MHPTDGRKLTIPGRVRRTPGGNRSKRIALTHSDCNQERRMPVAVWVQHARRLHDVLERITTVVVSENQPPADWAAFEGEFDFRRCPGGLLSLGGG
jgi:hypothetical protein